MTSDDAAFLRFLVRRRWLSPTEAEDVEFLHDRFGGRRSVSEILLARGYLDDVALAEAESASGFPKVASPLAEGVVPTAVFETLGEEGGAEFGATIIAPRPEVGPSPLESGRPDVAATVLRPSPFEVETSGVDAELPSPSSHAPTPLTVMAGYVVTHELASSPQAQLLEAKSPRGEAVVLRVLEGPHPLLPAPPPRRHPNLVNLLDVVEDHGRPVLVLERVQSLTLDELIGVEGPLAGLRVAELARDLSAGLTAVHGYQRTHGEICADRVFVEPGGGFRLAGLGYPPRSSTAPRPTLTAPELAWAEPSPATDLYALGGVLYLALTGELPFDPQDPLALTRSLDKVADDLGRRRPDTSAELRGLVLDLLEPTPNTRPKSAAVVVDRASAIAVREQAAEGGARTQRLEVEWPRLLLENAALLLGLGAVGVVVSGVAPLALLSSTGAAGLGVALLVAATLELMRQGRVPFAGRTGVLLRLRDTFALGGATALIASGAHATRAESDLILAIFGALLVTVWGLGGRLRAAIAAARRDKGRGRVLAVLGDGRLRRWRRAALPMTVIVAVWSALRVFAEAYFSS